MASSFYDVTCITQQLKTQGACPTRGNVLDSGDLDLPGLQGLPGELGNKNTSPSEFLKGQVEERQGKKHYPLGEDANVGAKLTHRARQRGTGTALAQARLLSFSANNCKHINEVTSYSLQVLNLISEILILHFHI